MKNSHTASKIKDGQKQSKAPSEGSLDTIRPDKEPKRTLFNDLSQFKNTHVSIITFGGEIVRGKLVCYDEVANCVVEDKEKGTALVFGKSITMVCGGDVSSIPG